MGIEVALSNRFELEGEATIIRGGKQGLNRICNLGAKTRTEPRFKSVAITYVVQISYSFSCFLFFFPFLVAVQCVCG
jgi:hypothetical protein